MAEVVESYVKAMRELAVEKKIPLIDFYKEIIDRRPQDFNKSLMGDTLHPSDDGKGSFSEESLKNSGYSLRNYLTLQTFAEVHKVVLAK